MVIDETRHNAFMAQRALHREEMTEFGQDINWLQEPDLIPAAVTEYAATPESNPFFNVKKWMVVQLARWAEERHAQLSLGTTFNEHELTNAERIQVRENFREYAEMAYAPGISAMSEIHGIVPMLAAREGIDRAEWPAIASEARAFGRRLSLDGTEVQALIRDYLTDSVDIHHGRTFDPSKLMLHKSLGITTVTPLDKLVQAAKAVSPSPGYSAVCVALEAKPKGFSGKNMFDLTWDAYSTVAANHIYPTLDVETQNIPPTGEADHRIYETFAALEPETLIINSLVQAINTRFG